MSRVSIEAFRRDLSGVDKRFRKKAAKIIRKHAELLLIDFRKRSAYDTGDYARGWYIAPLKITSDNQISVSLENRVSYAPALVEGAARGGPPWYFPRKGNKSWTSRSGKLFISQPRSSTGAFLKGGQRVWAGGLLPGKARATGGVLAGKISTNSFQNNLSLELLAVMAESI